MSLERRKERILTEEETESTEIASENSAASLVKSSPISAPVAAEPDRIAARITQAAVYIPDAQIKDFGLRGWFRAFQILWFFTVFAGGLLLDWFAELDPKDVEGRMKTAFHRIVRFFYRNRLANLEEARRNRAEWMRERMAALGPTFIKIGQTLSTRPDVVPLEYTKELSKLQDQVPAFSRAIAWDTIESELGKKPEEIFARIEHEPVAAASLGQVYRARLRSGETVAVKVQRPYLEQLINLDLAVLRQFAKYIEEKHPHIAFGIEWQPIIKEFAMIIFEELDYLQEAENAEIFRKNFVDWKEIYVPKIHWKYSSRKVLVEEFIDGLKVDDVRGLTDRHIEPIEIVKLISRTYLKQLLEDGFFHADPHPGNLRVMEDGRLAFFDFGMVGRLTQEMQTKLVDCFFHISEKDVSGLVEDLIELKFLKTGFDPDEFRPAIEEIFSHYIGMKLGQLKFKELTYAISETIYKLPFTFPADVTFVMRALTTLEGIGITVDPSFSFFDTVKPYAKEFMLKRESRYLRDKLIGKLVRGDDGKISWSKIWKLAKMAFRFYLGPKEEKNPEQ